jgi:hypothetical protein
MNKKLMKIIKVIKRPELIVVEILKSSFFRLMEDTLYLKIKFKLLVGYKLNLENPKSFNEKLQFLKIFDRNPKYSILADKIAVREYIEETIGKSHLIPLLGVWEKFDDIDFDTLPDQFVLKPNHTSGHVFVCKDKSKIDYKSLKRQVKGWLKREHYWNHREWCYKNIKPLILCEKYLSDESSSGLIDYKLLCFNGKVKCSFVALNRNSQNGLNIDFYDHDWNLMPFERHYPTSGEAIAKPKCYDQMVDYAEKISKDLIFARIDFYEVHGHLYFGEITLYPGAGFEEFNPVSYDYLLGSWINLMGNETKVK